MSRLLDTLDPSPLEMPEWVSHTMVSCRNKLYQVFMPTVATRYTAIIYHEGIHVTTLALWLLLEI